MPSAKKRNLLRIAFLHDPADPYIILSRDNISFFLILFMLRMFSASQGLFLSPLQVLSVNFSPLNPSLDLHSTNLLLLSR